MGHKKSVDVIDGIAIDNPRNQQSAYHQLVSFGTEKNTPYIDYTLASPHAQYLPKNIVSEEFVALAMTSPEDAIQLYEDDILENTQDKKNFIPFIKKHPKKTASPAITCRFEYDPIERRIDENSALIFASEAFISQVVTYRQADMTVQFSQDNNGPNNDNAYVMLHDLALNYKKDNRPEAADTERLAYQDVIQQMHIMVQKSFSKEACENGIHCVHKINNAFINTSSLAKENADDALVPITTTSKDIQSINNAVFGFFLHNNEKNILTPEQALAIALVTPFYQQRSKNHRPRR